VLKARLGLPQLVHVGAAGGTGIFHPPLAMSANNSRELPTLSPRCIDGQSYAVIYFTCWVKNAEGPKGARQTHISRMNNVSIGAGLLGEILVNIPP
jgi:hypothetical protein